jgi:Na+/melibiose symporter-like transporter
MLAFVAPALAVGALGIPLSLYLPPYYSGHVGLSLASVGLAFFIVRTIDIGFDPLIGLAIDRTRTRWGQCRPWFVGGAALISAGCLVLFLATPGATVAHLVLGLLVLYAGYSIVTVAHPAWAARLAPQYDERSKVYAWLYAAQAVGTFLILGAPTAFSAALGLEPGGDVHLMGWGIALAMPIGLAIALWRVREPPPAREAAHQRARLTDYIAILRRPSVARLIAADAFTSVGVGTSTSLFMFFWRAHGVSRINTSVLVLIYLASSLASVPLWMALARKIGKHRALILSCLGFVVVIPGMGFLPPNRLEILGPAIAVLGLTFSGTFLIRAMAADAADDVRLHTGLERTGQVYALLASTAKVGSAIAVGGAYAILGAVGFNAAESAANSTAAVRTLGFLYLGFPAFAMICGALAFLGYKLDNKEHARIRRVLAERDGATPLQAA